jgi:tetratricopeptide (TPR) repeat protein
MIGTTIAHYRVLEQIGGGGMGVVYKAQDLRLGRLVALKFLSDEYAGDAKEIERLRREARAVSALNHPNICTLYDIAEADGRTFLVMELLEGRNLREIIVEHGAVPTERFLRIAVDVAEGLQAAHEKGILHRDLKPANIFVTERGAAKILDFGLAKIGSAQPTAGAAVGAAADLESHTGGWAMGTAAYMSPEQALGKPLDERSDVFSLGAVLYEMATGTLAFTGDTTGTLFLAIVQGTPTPPRTLIPTLPEPLQQIIGKCLEKDRQQRYQRAADLLVELKRIHAEPSSTNRQRIAAVSPRRRLRPWALWLAGAAAALLAAVGLISFAGRARASALTSKDPIVIADLANMTGDPVFDGTLRQALTIQLRQSPFLKIVDDGRIASTLRLMSRAPDERLTRPVAREVCQRTNSKAYLTGSIDKSGGRYDVGLQALACADDRLLASSAGKADSREQVLAALDEAGNGMRRKLGESLPSVEALSRPLAEVTTSSLEALQALSTGRAVAQEQGYQAAMPYYKRALELDPNFAAAYVSLGTTYSNLQQRDLAAANYRRAYELRNRVTERERYLIESREFSSAGDLSRDVEICLQWTSKYPNDESAHNRLGVDYLYLGSIEKAAEQFRQAIAVSDDSSAPWLNLSIAYRRLGRLEEAQRVLDDPRASRWDSESIRIQRYMLAFLEGNAAAMQEQVKRSAGRPGYEDSLLFEQSLVAAQSGRLAEFRTLNAQARVSAEKASGSGRTAVYLVNEAINEGYLGNLARARELATQCLALPSSRNIVQRTALALALAGDNAAAMKVLQNLTANPSAVLIHNYAAPVIGAHVEMNNGRPEKSIELLQAALPYDFAIAEFSALQPAYARGLAYLQLHKGPEAAREFQKLIDNRGAVFDSILGVLARLQRARAQVLSGNLNAARTDYQDFLALWKDADPDIPVLQQAKLEYEKLK